MPDVDRFISVEKMRDGGSFAVKFDDRLGNQYILFTKIRFADVGQQKEDQHGYSQEREIVGYEKPVIIDCDPAKRPQNTETRIYSELCGPASRVSWDRARKIIGKLGDLAPGLAPIQAEWLKQMTAVVEGEGNPQPGSRTRSTWHRRL